jgi:peptidoglycan LD-endopeptidase CwlK
MKRSAVAIGLVLGAAALFFRKGSGRPVAAPPPGLQQSMVPIGTLDPDVQAKALELLRAAWHVGLPLVVTEGYRSAKDQAIDYAKGRTTPGPIVTNAPPGSSWHQYRKAFDVAVLVGGQATWPNDVALWRRIGDVGERLGLEWGGDSTTFVDRPHFAWHPGVTLAEARANA